MHYITLLLHVITDGGSSLVAAARCTNSNDAFLPLLYIYLYICQANPKECDEVMEAVIRTVTMTGSREIPRDQDEFKSR